MLQISTDESLRDDEFDARVGAQNLILIAAVTSMDRLMPR
jgi:hypothetical protein